MRCSKCGKEDNLIGSAYVEIDEVLEAGYSNDVYHICKDCLKEIKELLEGIESA